MTGRLLDFNSGPGIVLFLEFFCKPYLLQLFFTWSCLKSGIRLDPDLEWLGRGNPDQSRINHSGSLTLKKTYMGTVRVPFSLGTALVPITS